MSLHAQFRQHFPFAAISFTAGALLIGDGTPAILMLAASIALLPVAYAHDAEDIARATREGHYAPPAADEAARCAAAYNRSQTCAPPPTEAPLARSPIHR